MTLRRSFLLKACTITLWSSTPLAVALVTFTCYVVLGAQSRREALDGLNALWVLNSVVFG